MVRDSDLEQKLEPEIERALGARFGNAPPAGEADLESLYARLSEAAEPLLAARPLAPTATAADPAASLAPWWVPVSRWTRIGLPTGLAAAALLVVALVRTPSDRVDAAGVADVALEDVVSGSAEQAPAGRLLFAGTTDEYAAALLDAEEGRED